MLLKKEAISSFLLFLHIIQAFPHNIKRGENMRQKIDFNWEIAETFFSEEKSRREALQKKLTSFFECYLEFETNNNKEHFL